MNEMIRPLSDRELEFLLNDEPPDENAEPENVEMMDDLNEYEMAEKDLVQYDITEDDLIQVAIDTEENILHTLNEGSTDSKQVEESEIQATITENKNLCNKECEKTDRDRNKRKREKGCQYKGYRKSREGKFLLTETRGARKMLPVCHSSMCKKAKKRFCHNLNGEFRSKLFGKFWGMSWDMKKVSISTLMTAVGTKRSTTDNPQRNVTFEYHLKQGEKTLRVCKKTFLNTFGINEWMARNWCLNSTSGMHTEEREKNTPLRKRLTEEKNKSLNILKQFFDEIPKLHHFIVELQHPSYT